MPDGTEYIIKDIRRQLQVLLPEALIKELDNQQKRQSAGWLVEEIEGKLKGIERICQKN